MSGHFVRKLAAGFVMALVMLSAFSARSSELRVTVKRVQSDKGEVLVGLYDAAKGFEGAIATAETSGLMADRNRLVGVAMRARTGSDEFVFAQLPPGRYAVIVLHDENDDGRLDATSMGIPTEGYGFSNNAHGFMGAPSFDVSAVTIDAADKSIAISLTYPWDVWLDDSTQQSTTPEDEKEFDDFLGRGRGHK